MDGRLAAALGVGAVAVAFGGIFAAMALSPRFTVTGNALSDLGEVGTSTSPIFNLALMLGGALGCAFAVVLWPTVTDPGRSGALVVLWFAMVFMALTGAFPLPTAPHGVVAVLFFLLMTVGVFAWGVADFRLGRTIRGSVLVVASALHVVAWFWWAVYDWPGEGIAVPELVGAATLGIWAVWLSVDACRTAGDGPSLPSR